MSKDVEQKDVIQVLLKEKYRLQTRINEIKVVLKNYMDESLITEPPPYILPSETRKTLDPKFPLKEKIILQIMYIIYKMERFLTVKEILEKMKPYYNNQKINARVSSALNYELKHKSNFPKLYQIKSSNKIDTLWGLNEWLDIQGNIKPEHKPIKNKK